MGGTVVVTGAAGGIAAPLLPMLQARRHDLLLVDTPQAAASGAMATAEKTAASKQLQCRTAASSLESLAACQAALAMAASPPVALVHLAGVFEPDPELAHDHGVWDRAIDHNLRNAYDMATAFVDVMRAEPPASPARLVFVSSLAFRWGAHDHVPYAAAKGGIVGLTRALAKRLAPRARVNALAPGIIDTTMPAKVIADRGEALLERIPLRRFGQAREVAGVVDFLLSDAAGYITAQTINVDGGLVSS